MTELRRSAQRMARYILYAYVDGYDLDGIAADLEAAFASFIASRQWQSGKASFVSQRGKEEEKKGDLPRWDLGLNLELRDSKGERSAHFADVEEIAIFLRSQSEKFKREFILGVLDLQGSDTWEFAFIDDSPVNIERIRRALT